MIDENVRLSDVAEFDPPTPRNGKLGAATTADFLPMAAVDADSLIACATEQRPIEMLLSGFTYFIDGDVLVAKITPCFENGKIAEVKLSSEHGFGSTEFHVVRAKAGQLHPRYLTHFLRQPSVRHAGERRMTGSAGQRRVPRDFLKELAIPLPPLEEQRQIAAILDKADALRQKRRAALQKLDSLTQSLFLDMFGDPIANPKGWPRAPFYELLKNIDSGSSPICLDRPATLGEWGVLKLGAVTKCEFNDQEQKALPQTNRVQPELEVKGGDLLFSRKNTRDLVAACALVRHTRPRLLLPDLIFRFIFSDDAPVEKEFLHQLLIFPSKRKKIQQLAGGSAGSMPNISKTNLMRVEIEMPPIQLQRQFVSRVRAMHGLRRHLTGGAEATELVFASLQHRAFRGEL